MSSQRDPNRQAVMCYLPMETAMRLRTVIDGKTVRNKVREGLKVHKPMRPMGMSDYLISLAEKAVRKVTPSSMAVAWGKEKLAKNIRARRMQDERVKRGESRKANARLRSGCGKGRGR